MSEPHLCLLRVDAVPEEQRRARVSERVEANPGHRSTLRGGLQDTSREILGIKGSAVTGGEQERIVRLRPAEAPERACEPIRDRDRSSAVPRFRRIEPAAVETPSDIDAALAEVHVGPCER